MNLAIVADRVEADVGVGMEWAKNLVQWLCYCSVQCCHDEQASIADATLAASIIGSCGRAEAGGLRAIRDYRLDADNGGDLGWAQYLACRP